MRAAGYLEFAVTVSITPFLSTPPPSPLSCHTPHGWANCGQGLAGAEPIRARLANSCHVVHQWEDEL